MTTPSTPPTQRPRPKVLQRARDEQHLKTLTIFYYILAGFSALLGCLGLMYIGIGAAMALFAEGVTSSDPDAPPPGLIRLIGLGIAGIGGLALTAQLVVAVLQFLAGRFIALRRHRMFCLVIAGLICLGVPLGTALGVYTFVILTRPGVIEWFGGRRQPAIGR